MCMCMRTKVSEWVPEAGGNTFKEKKMVVRWESCTRTMRPLLWLPFFPPIRSRRSASLLTTMRCFLWSAPLCCIRRLIHTPSPSCSSRDGSRTMESDADEDPVFSFLKPFSQMPLVQLAKLLPDEAIERLENGLKNHLQRFPDRYRLFHAKNGLLHVELTDGGSFHRRAKVKKNVQKEPPVSPTLHMDSPVPSRLFTLESIMNFSDPKRVVDSETSPGKEDNPGWEGELLEKISLFVRERLFPLRKAEVWLLTEEHMMDKPRTITTTAGTGMEGGTTDEEQQNEKKHEKRTLQAFRWVHIKDIEQFDSAVSKLRHEIFDTGLKHGINVDGGVCFARPTTAGTTRSTFYARFIVPMGYSAVEDKIVPDECDDIIEDYNVYRLCRILNTKTFLKLPELQDIAGEWLTQPLAAVLAISGEESKALTAPGGMSTGRSIFDFEYDPADSTRVVGVRFWLDEKRYLPSLYHEKTLSELQEELSEFNGAKLKKPKNAPNHVRVRYIEKKRLLQRCIALHELGVSPLCHPDVLAYYLFDLLPLDNRLILAGHLPKLLPDDLQRITDARPRAWLKQYPHLFRLVEHPPELFVQRIDAPAEKSGEDSNMNDSRNEELQRVNVGHEEESIMTESLQKQIDYEKQLLVSPEEQLQFMVSLVATRLEVCKSRNLLPSHLPKFITTELRRAIIPRHSGGILSYLQRYPDVFVLTYGVHPHEPVVTLTPRFHPDLEKSSQGSTNPIDTVDSVKEKEE